MLTLNWDNTWAVTVKRSIVTHQCKYHAQLHNRLHFYWTVNKLPAFLYQSFVLYIVDPDLNIYSSDLEGEVPGQESYAFTLQLPGLLQSCIIE